MAYSIIPKTKRDGKIELIDGTGSPVTMSIAYEDGNFSFYPVDNPVKIYK